jgi:hypothetical protein
MSHWHAPLLVLFIKQIQRNSSCGLMMCNGTSFVR